MTNPRPSQEEHTYCVDFAWMLSMHLELLHCFASAYVPRSSCRPLTHEWRINRRSRSLVTANSHRRFVYASWVLFFSLYPVPHRASQASHEVMPLQLPQHNLVSLSTLITLPQESLERVQAIDVHKPTLLRIRFRCFMLQQPHPHSISRASDPTSILQQLHQSSPASAWIGNQMPM